MRLRFFIITHLRALRGLLFAMCQWAFTLARLFVLAAFVLSIAAVSANAQRPLTPDDLTHLERLGEAVLSPDGDWLAYVRERANIGGSRLHSERIDRGDVWLVGTSGGTPRNLTNGAAMDTGYWLPTWSPDSKRIAMFSTQENTTQLWVWEMESKRLRQASERGVASGLLRQVKPTALMYWLSDHRLVCTVLPEGAKPEAITQAQAIRDAMRSRSEALRGHGSTVSVLYSGVATSAEERPQIELLLVDLDKGSKRLSSSASIIETYVAPDLRHIAFLEQSGVVQPRERPTAYSAWDGHIFRLGVLDSSGNVLSVDSTADDKVIPGSLRWSLDSSEIAFVRWTLGRAGSSLQIERCQLDPWSCSTQLTGELMRTDPNGGLPSPTAIVWAGKNDLLVHVGSDEPRETIEHTGRWDWWVVPRTGEARNLTAGMNTVPSQLFSEVGGESVVGLADGKLWRLWLGGNKRPEPIGPKIASVVWPKSRIWPFIEGNFSDLIVSMSRDNVEKGNDFLRLNLASGRTTQLNAPSSAARLADFSLTGNVAVFTSNNRTGTYLWLSKPSGEKPVTIVETNTYLRGIAEAQTRRVEYRSSDGQELKAWLLLPQDFKEGKRYPLVTWVYPGSLYGDAPPGEDPLNRNSSLNLQLLVARGYAVLEPSMPLKPVGQSSDPYMELTKGVLPAVEKVIEMGIADPKRLGVMGHSYGGYGTYGLVTQTNRFQAAISMAGMSDLVSAYGEFDATLRYDAFPQENLWHLRWAEEGQGRMGNPPWKDMARYVRNSPLSYIDHVETPLMIIQGEMDLTSMQQGEEFFSGLYRQDKLAEFVRYWGEGHAVQEPANVRDMWQRIFAWLDEFLDISRDQHGRILWDGDNLKSRSGAPPLKPEDFGRFDVSTGSGAKSE